MPARDSQTRSSSEESWASAHEYHGQPLQEESHRHKYADKAGQDATRVNRFDRVGSAFTERSRTSRTIQDGSSNTLSLPPTDKASGEPVDESDSSVSEQDGLDGKPILGPWDSQSQHPEDTSENRLVILRIKKISEKEKAVLKALPENKMSEINWNTFCVHKIIRRWRCLEESRGLGRCDQAVVVPHKVVEILATFRINLNHLTRAQLHYLSEFVEEPILVGLYARAYRLSGMLIWRQCCLEPRLGELEATRRLKMAGLGYYSDRNLICPAEEDVWQLDSGMRYRETFLEFRGSFDCQDNMGAWGTGSFDDELEVVQWTNTDLPFIRETSNAAKGGSALLLNSSPKGPVVISGFNSRDGLSFCFSKAKVMISLGRACCKALPYSYWNLHALVECIRRSLAFCKKIL